MGRRELVETRLSPLGGMGVGCDVIGILGWMGAGLWRRGGMRAACVARQRDALGNAAGVGTVDWSTVRGLCAGEVLGNEYGDGSEPGLCCG